MRKITNIVIHCSDSEWGCVREIRSWHMQRGWRDIGYHFVILNGNIDSDATIDFPFLDGSIECGRFLNEDLSLDGREIGSHALGYNDKSVGICLIGKKSFTIAQFSSLKRMLIHLLNTWRLPVSAVIGHYEIDKTGKTCPNFNVSALRDELAKDLKGR